MCDCAHCKSNWNMKHLMLPKVSVKTQISKSNDHVFITCSLPLKFESKFRLNHMLKNNIKKILDSVLFFHTPKLESHIVPNVFIELNNKSKKIEI
jgi:hypothetical protein